MRGQDSYQFFDAVTAVDNASAVKLVDLEGPRPEVEQRLLCVRFLVVSIRIGNLESSELLIVPNKALQLRSQVPSQVGLNIARSDLVVLLAPGISFAGHRDILDTSALEQLDRIRLAHPVDFWIPSDIDLAVIIRRINAVTLDVSGSEDQRLNLRDLGFSKVDDRERVVLLKSNNGVLTVHGVRDVLRLENHRRHTRILPESHTLFLQFGAQLLLVERVEGSNFDGVSKGIPHQDASGNVRSLSFASYGDIAAVWTPVDSVWEEAVVGLELSVLLQALELSILELGLEDQQEARSAGFILDCGRDESASVADVVTDVDGVDPSVITGGEGDERLLLQGLPAVCVNSPVGSVG
mmetsp:Transcript_15173/g.62168  ORF Transcript_15173/g.62168 Transcript_15173/m.62168 type:complete len:352 (+) Transcript_15173:992-2047(+)